ncbi:MAG: AAA family ATPase, partial [Candidatus Cloacimonetes bacterium]|nr:AAA family ATPase [Candidatus Cloacimonadota bacterium]
NPDFLYVDKSELISEFLEDQCKILLITRPRRFGKTLNLSTLRYFFDKDYAHENRKLFEGLKVSQNQKAMAEQGTRPVIYHGHEQSGGGLHCLKKLCQAFWVHSA